jgi:hypothetical protein
MTYSLETVYQVWNDKTGDRLDIKPDSDSLDLIEVRYVNEAGEIGSSITMTREVATLLRKALGKMLGEE